MKKILMSSLVILTMLVAVTGSALAVFSESEEITNNTIGAAHIDIDLRALNSGDIDKPINVQGLVPGQYTNWARVEVYNTSPSIPVRLFFYVKDLSGDACPMVNLDVRTGHASGNEKQFLVYYGDILGVDDPSEKKEITGPGRVFTTTIPPNWTSVVQQRAQLDVEAGDDIQSKTCTWTEVFVAESPEVLDD